MTESILVVGGAGYIGSHVVQTFLEAGYQVTVFDNMSSGQKINLFPQARFIHGDVQDRNQLQRLFSGQHYDAVVHLAALKAAGESMEVPEQYAHQNMNGSVNASGSHLPLRHPDGYFFLIRSGIRHRRNIFRWTKRTRLNR